MVQMLKGVIRGLERLTNDIGNRIRYREPIFRFPPEVTQHSHNVAFSSRNLADVIHYAMKEGFQIGVMTQISNEGGNAELNIYSDTEFGKSRYVSGKIRSAQGEFSLYLRKSEQPVEQLNLPLAPSNTPTTKVSNPNYAFEDSDILEVLRFAEEIGYRPTRFVQSINRGTSAHLELKTVDGNRARILMDGSNYALSLERISVH